MLRPYLTNGMFSEEWTGLSFRERIVFIVPWPGSNSIRTCGQACTGSVTVGTPFLAMSSLPFHPSHALYPWLKISSVPAWSHLSVPAPSARLIARKTSLYCK